jgi:hypothetical protein
MGPFEEGTYTPDSLSFGIVGFEYRARYDGKRMTHDEYRLRHERFGPSSSS